MQLCRFQNQSSEVRIGLVSDPTTVLDLSAAGVREMQPLLEARDLLTEINKLRARDLPHVPLTEVRLCAPVERQEVWAAGVTYLRSKTARIDESDFCASAYDKVYAAERPELFFKSMPEKVIAPGEPVGIRRDARWSVPEPELALVLNSRGEIVGHTIGNDMSSRDIEGENLLYLPQAKIMLVRARWVPGFISARMKRRRETGPSASKSGGKGNAYFRVKRSPTKSNDDSRTWPAFCSAARFFHMAPSC